MDSGLVSTSLSIAPLSGVRKLGCRQDAKRFNKDAMFSSVSCCCKVSLNRTILFVASGLQAVSAKSADPSSVTLVAQ